MFFFVSDTLKQLNQSADPCTDFYEFACGGWENENALEPGETSVTGFSLVREKSYNVLKQALENAEKNYSSVRKCLNFFSQKKALMLSSKAYSAQTSSRGTQFNDESPPFLYQNEAVMKTLRFYNICLDEAAVEALGDSPLKKLIDDLGGWNVTGNMMSLSSMNITQRIGKVSSELLIKPFIDIKVFINPHDSNKHILQVRLVR